MPLILKRQPDTRPDKQFWYVHDETGKVVGRIYRETPGRMSGLTECWFWGLSHPYERGRVQPHYGNAPTREHAMQNFGSVWRSKT